MTTGIGLLRGGESPQAWMNVAAAFAIYFAVIGVPAVMIPTLYAPILDDTGWTRGDVAMVSSIKFGVGAVAAFLTGYAIEWAGVKRVTIVCALMTGVALLLFLAVQSLWVFYLVGALLGASALGTTVGMKVLVSEWFEKRQGFAIGVALMGTSTAGVIVPLLTTRLSEAVGWRLTGALMSLAIWLVALPFFLWKAKDFPRGLGDVAHSVAGEAPAPARAPDLRGLRLSPTFWVLCAVFFLIGMVDHAMAAHLPIFFNKEAGLGPHVAALGFSLIMLMSNVGKVGYGWLFDRLSMRGAAICWMVAAAGILLTFPIGAALTMCIFAVVYGPTQGGMLVSVPVLAKHAFGPQALAKTVAIFSTVFMIGSAVGPALAGYMFDHYGNYDLAFGVMAASAALAGLLVLLARRRPMLESLAQADHLAPTGPQSAQA